MPTATLNVGYCNEQVNVRAFFDTSSHRSFISPEVVKRLNLRVIKQVPVNLSTFGNETESCMLDLVKVKVRLGKSKIPLTMLLHDNAAMSYFHSPGLYEVAQKLESKGFNLADHNITSDALTGIEILIGVDNFTRLIVRQKRSHGTSLFVTRGGGVIPFGPLPRWAVSTSKQSSQVRCARILCENKPDLENTQLWELGRVGILPESFSPSERETISLVRSNMQQSESGYIVRLPFKDDTSPSVNYRTARGQLNHLVQRGENDEQFGQHCNKVVESYVDKEFIEQIPNHSVEGHYMPHHAVFKKSATTPLRIVFNASSKPNEGKSLNDCLMTGPSLTAKLHKILVQFHQETHAVTADISKAFHRIIVDKDHRKFLKFLWINLESYELLTYQFKVVLFGATCSPYLLQETLQTHLSQNAEGNKFVDKFYVDNYMNTYDNQDELVTDKVTLDNVMNQASTPLQEWVSNNDHFNSLYQPAVPITQNVLGISWNPNTDNMKIVVWEKLIHEDSWRYTKRKVLSLVPSIYDPLGWVSPLTVRGKMFIQTLWKEKMGWDQNLNPDQIKVIRDILVDLQRVGEFFFPRHILHEHSELHVFADAYGAAVYIVNDTCTHSNLLMSKARVAPCKEDCLTIPKLELTVSLIGARLNHYLTNLFKFQTIYLWSYSKVAISWITSDRDIKDLYVANRTAEIKTLINQHQVRVMYVPTKDNPADYLSRGCTSKQLKSSNWLHGPSWLLTREFPEQTNTNIVVNELTVEINPVHPLIDLTKFSLYTRVGLLRIMIRVLEFCQSPANPFEKLVRQEQLLHCTSIHAHLTNSRTKVNVEVKTTIKQLNLHLINDVIRAKGRIINSELPLDATTPLFLPNKSHLVDLLINHIHSSHHHVGLSQTLSLYRQRCWTPKIRSRIKSLLPRCVTYQRIKGRTLPRPLPPPLPAE